MQVRYFFLIFFLLFFLRAIIGSESMIALVRDGTHCAPGKVCIENACVPLSQVSAPIYCPSNNLALQCSGHGVNFFLF